MQIEDGAGSGRKVRVSSENRIQSDAIIQTTEHFANHSQGVAFNIVFSQAASGTDQAIFFLQNLADADMDIEGIWLSVNAAAEVYFQIENADVPGTNSTVSPVNLNTGSGKNANAIFVKGADLDSASGIAGGSEFNRFIFRAATNTFHFNFEQDVIITKNSTLSIWCSTTAIVQATLVLNFHELNDT